MFGFDGKDNQRCGWTMTIKSTKLKVLTAAVFVAVTICAIEAIAQSDRESRSELAAPLGPLSHNVGESQLFAELEARNQLRKAALFDYTVQRIYQVVDLNGKVHAEETGQMQFRAPDQKTFVATSATGSGLIRRMALNPLISSEIEAAAGKAHHDSAISSANYSLELLGEQQVGAYHCFVAKAVPKRKEKYLFEGTLWIDADDYAIVRIEGHPAKKLSFWIERAEFVRQYQKVDGFWLPAKDQTQVQVRLYGKKVLTIEHQNYVVNAGENHTAQNAVAQNTPVQNREGQAFVQHSRVRASADSN